MSHHTHSSAQEVLWPDQRSEEQEAIIDEKKLDDIPRELYHETVFSANYIGIPEETHVYEIAFRSDEFGTPSICTEWLLSAQEQGWEVVKVYQGHTHYSSHLRFRLRRLPIIGHLFGEDGLKIRIQREAAHSREQSPTEEASIPSQQLEGEA